MFSFIPALKVAGGCIYNRKAWGEFL